MPIGLGLILFVRFMKEPPYASANYSRSSFTVVLFIEEEVAILVILRDAPKLSNFDRLR